MESHRSRRNTIEKAASLARGDRLSKLRSICEGQKTISTAKLELMLDELHEDMKQDAIHLRALADNLQEC